MQSNIVRGFTESPARCRSRKKSDCAKIVLSFQLHRFSTEIHWGMATCKYDRYMWRQWWREKYARLQSYTAKFLPCTSRFVEFCVCAQLYTTVEPKMPFFFKNMPFARAFQYRLIQSKEITLSNVFQPDIKWLIEPRILLVIERLNERKKLQLTKKLSNEVENGGSYKKIHLCKSPEVDIFFPFTLRWLFTFSASKRHYLLEDQFWAQ